MPEAVTLELYRSTDHVTFPGTRKIVRILVVGKFEGDPPLVRCRLTGVDSDLMIRLNGVREKSTTAMPHAEPETDRLVARFDITPSQPGKIAATFSVDNDQSVAPVDFEIEVIPKESNHFFVPRPIKGLH